MVLVPEAHTPNFLFDSISGLVPLDLPAVAGGDNLNLPAVAGGEVPRGSSLVGGGDEVSPR